jgi:hypothetical protein
VSTSIDVGVEPRRDSKEAALASPPGGITTLWRCDEPLCRVADPELGRRCALLLVEVEADDKAAGDGSGGNELDRANSGSRPTMPPLDTRDDGVMLAEPLAPSSTPAWTSGGRRLDGARGGLLLLRSIAFPFSSWIFPRQIFGFPSLACELKENLVRILTTNRNSALFSNSVTQRNRFFFHSFRTLPKGLPSPFSETSAKRRTLFIEPISLLMGRRGAGRRLNDQERMEIIEILSRETKVKNVELAKRYGVSEGAIRKLKQMKDAVRDRYVMGNEQNRDKRKRGGFVRNAKFEQELYDWICRMRETQAYQLVPLTQTAVRQEAMLLAKKYDSMATFKASPGWFARFCARHRLDPPVHAGTGLAADDITLAASTAAVGDTVPGGPLASAYQVDPALAAAPVGIPDAASAASFADALTKEAEAVKRDQEALDLNCGEAVVEQQAQLVSAATAAAAGTAPSTETLSLTAVATPKDDDVKKAAAKGVMPSDDEIFGLGL